MQYQSQTAGSVGYTGIKSHSLIHDKHINYFQKNAQ